MTQAIVPIPVDARTPDWPRKVAQVVNRLQNTTLAAAGTAAWGSITGTLADQTDLATALNLKANLAGPTFTGTVVLPSTTSIGTVSATELSYVDGVTSAIQTQLDAKLDAADIGVSVQAYDADLTTWAGVTPGTGVATALGVNIGLAGAFVTFDGALGTPASGSLVNCTFPTLNQNTTGTAASLTSSRLIEMSGDMVWSVTFDGSGNVTAAGTLATVNTNVGTFGSAVNSAQFVVNAKGLITSAANLTITPAVGSITGLGTNVATALGVAVGSAGAFVTFNGAGGTPSSIVLTNATGLPTAGLVDDAVTFAKVQNIATAKVLGRSTAGTGDVEELATTGTGNVVMSAAPAFSGTVTGGALSLSGLLTLSGAGAVLKLDSISDSRIEFLISGVRKGLITSNPGSVDFIVDSGNVFNTYIGATIRTEVSATGLSVTGTGAFSGDVTVPDEAYGAGWNGSLEVPTKNALYDKIETISAGALADADYGDITVSSSGTVWTIDAGAVTYAKIQDVSAASRLLGRGSAAGSGDTEELTVGLGLEISSAVLRRATGTSFPGSPATGDLFWRSDRSFEYEYDGTRWLTTERFERVFTFNAITASNTFWASPPYLGTYSVYLDTLETSTLRDAAGEWDILLQWVSLTNVATTLVTVDGNGTTSVNWIATSNAIGAVLDANAKALKIAVNEISGTSAFYGAVTLRFRLVG